ncbi:MAG: nuclear transport factor 2 family protein [Pyrinomonadaceae bacterium]|nr:nuclear transport factor 2 family protein [Pyrinomonadaceae bacterium]
MKRISVKQMHTRIAVVIMFMLALTAYVTFAVKTTATAPDNEAEVRRVLLQNSSAFERNDLAALEKIWAHDESVTVFESGHANYGWTDYRDHHLVPEMREMKNTKYALSDMKISLAGKTAWATFKYTISADLKERHVDGGGLGTAVLEERDGRWQIVHWHSSAPRRAPAKKN